MAVDKTRKQSVRRGGNLVRSETVTVRLDPKLRYLAELAARKQRRTVSSFIEWAIEEALDRVWFHEKSGETGRSIASEGADLWDVDEPDRLVKLAARYPDLLTYDEQVLWKRIREQSGIGNDLTEIPKEYWNELLQNYADKLLDVARSEFGLSSSQEENPSGGQKPETRKTKASTRHSDR